MKLGDGHLEKGKGRCPHGMRVIHGSWWWRAKSLLVEKSNNLFCSDGCMLVVGEIDVFSYSTPSMKDINLMKHFKYVLALCEVSILMGLMFFATGITYAC
jgi:hypothetical protein